MPTWKEVPEQAQQDMLEWLNSTKPDASDKRRLAKLYFTGKFHAWNCVECGDRVYFGNPVEWNHFQGARQADYISFPGSRDSPRRNAMKCDHCRMHCIPTDTDLMMTGIGEPRIWADEEECYR